ncbi:MAG: Hsp20/alpha crystallin family protein [Chloroflexota bacterium]
MKLMKLEPTSEFVSLREAVDKLFEDSFIRPFNGFGTTTTFPVDLTETKDAYVLKGSLPGLRPEDLTIEATADGITIKGEFKAETEVKDVEYLRKERHYGKVQRSFTLPLAIDPNKVEATFEYGVVTITLPKTEVVKPKTVTIKAKA